MFSCFPHIMNLACKAVLGAITNMDFAHQDSDVAVVTHDHTPADCFDEAIAKGPVAVIRTVIRIISTLLFSEHFILIVADMYLWTSPTSFPHNSASTST